MQQMRLFQQTALEAEEAAGKQNLHELNSNTSKLAGKSSRPVLSKYGKAS
jgi:hypothetical protein